MADPVNHIVFDVCCSTRMANGALDRRLKRIVDAIYRELEITAPNDTEPPVRVSLAYERKDVT